MDFDQAARPVQDDDARSSSSRSSYHSDGYTLPGDGVDDDACSIASASSYESYDTVCPRERLPSYRVAREQGTSQPVYEAWVLCLSHENDYEVTKVTSCGLDLFSTHEEERPFVVSRTESYEQDELADMTLASVNSHHAATRRGVAARLFRGKPKTYEQELDGRLRKLPVALQSNLNGLLRNREKATSNRFHRREWTVVMMREQYRYRFASAAPEPVKKKGFWKGKDSRRVEYLFVIRGAEGRVAADDKGMYQPREFGNPWKKVDEEERIMRQRSRDIRRFGKECVQDGWFPRPRGRSLSPRPDRPAPPQPPFRNYPPPPHPVITERGRPCARARSPGYGRSRSPSSNPSIYHPAAYSSHPPPNPFVPLHVPMGGMAPLAPPPPPPGPYICPGATSRFLAPPPPETAGLHLPPFGLPPFEHPARSQVPGHFNFPIPPPSPADLSPEQQCTWSSQPLGAVLPLTYDEREPLPVPVPMHRHTATAPFPFELSPPPQSPRPASFTCLGGGGAAPPAPSPRPPTVEEEACMCHRLFDADFFFSHDSAPALPPPPPPPKPSNLTTPTDLSPASSDHTGSTVHSTDA
ncbi:hypothetical protein diail_5047 [Diaporthe ilicicola]|nr:hypothetical protein diail_5047 [Diaporthe ilicicola]